VRVGRRNKMTVVSGTIHCFMRVIGIFVTDDANQNLNNSDPLKPPYHHCHNSDIKRFLSVIL
jgi:hypothetical protein